MNPSQDNSTDSGLGGTPDRASISTRGLRRRTLLTRAGAVIGASMVPALSIAQAPWRPTKPVRLLNGFSAGGSGDVLCRVLADALRPVVGETVVVDTRPGANGFIAAEAVARAAPDGHTIGMATMSMLTTAPQLPGVTVPINVDTELTPIGGLAGIYLLMVTHPGAPYKTVPELIAYAKANPGAVSYASAGTGSAPHLAGELFARQAGVNMVHVPYKGGAQALVDLTAGRVQLLIGNMPDYLSQIRSGLLRGVAFGGDKSAPALPELPQIRQWLPEFNITNWFGIVGPARLPANIANAWNAAMQTALNDPIARKRMADMGADPMFGSVAQFQKVIDTDKARWGSVIRAANIRVS